MPQPYYGNQMPNFFPQERVPQFMQQPKRVVHSVDFQAMGGLNAMMVNQQMAEQQFINARMRDLSPYNYLSRHNLDQAFQTDDPVSSNDILVTESDVSH